MSDTHKKMKDVPVTVNYEVVVVQTVSTGEKRKLSTHHRIATWLVQAENEVEAGKTYWKNGKITSWQQVD